ncbi:S1C family serine protease [Thiohalomonas denitrificans]|uniref:S1C family serine protease n=1 Tax=Thiohalomonas denitrificans TaxID=415747 RepID=UPI0026F2068D|nr:trypsin-like peptidase domain-containing protein [Thiohalomonas denitrificans]
MKGYKPLLFLFQSITVGLAAAFVVLLWRPELLENGMVVEIVESTTSAAVSPASGPVSYADAVARAAPAVVNIYTRKIATDDAHGMFDDPIFRHFFGDSLQFPPQERRESSLGSGVIVNARGYVLTNNHVIEDADTIRVALRDGRKAEAEVVGADPEADLAVLKIALEDLPTITLGRSEELQVGDVVLAIGNPFGVGQTVTLGIASATGRNQLGINTFENFIQTDAAINPGNSGGALITATGELVGINTAIFSRTGGSQGIGFAIPMTLAKGSMTQIIETGHVSRGWLGIEIQEITAELAESFGLESEEGVIIAGVLRDGPAYRSGLRPGDVVTRIGGESVADLRDALNTITRARPGDNLLVRGTRDGQPFELETEVAERPVQSASPKG